MMIATTEQAPVLIYSLLGLALVAICFAVPVANWVSGKLASILSFFPTERFHKSPPLMSKGEALTMRGEIHEAAALYLGYLKEQSRELDISLRLLDLAHGPLEDPEMGESVMARAKVKLEEREQRLLRSHRDAILSGEYYPLRHLAWREDQENEHPEVAIPETLKGQFAQS